MKKLIYLTVSLIMLGSGGCDILLGPDTPVGKGSLAIGFGGGGDRAALSEETLAGLRYELVLTGPGGEKIEASLSARETFNRQVALGEWRIDAEAFTPENSRIGEGMATIRVKAGANQARIPMRVIETPADIPVDALDLTGLVRAPVKDAAPDTTAIDAAQYTGTMAWQNEDGTLFDGPAFAPSTVYQAVVTLTAKTGFTFTGVPADSFSYSGAVSVSSAADSGTVIIRFPATAAPDADTTVNAFNLTGLVRAPVKDAAPDTTAIDAAQYTGTMAWQNEDGTLFDGLAFAPSTVYKAVVTLTAKPGFTFTGIGANSFSYSGATTVTNEADSGAVTVTFPATAGENAAQGITLSFTDGGSGAFSEETLTVKQGGTPAEQSRDINLSGTWTSREWRVNGVVKGTDATFTVNAGDYTVGGHMLQVMVSDGIHTWSRTLPFTVTAAVTGVSLNKTALSLPVNGTETLFAAVIPANAENRAVTWTTSASTVATVSNNGLVTAIVQGTATITAATVEGGYFDTCTVTVTEAAGDITIGFTDEGSGAFSGEPFAVKQDGTPAEQSRDINLSGIWTSREWRVDGVVKGTDATFTVDAGDYTVGGHTLQVTVSDGTHTWSRTLPFTVTAAVTGVSLNKTSLSLLVNGTETLIAAIVPANAENKAVTWASSDEAVATVSNNGLVTAKALGTAVITVKTTEGEYPGICTVTVGAAQGSINLDFTDEGSGAFGETTFTLTQGGTPDSQTINLLESWVSREWRVDGVVKDASAAAFTVNAADYTVGGHTLQVRVFDGTRYWSKTLQFTVTG